MLTNIPPAAEAVCPFLLLFTRKTTNGINTDRSSAKMKAKIIILGVKYWNEINPIFPPVYDAGRVIKYKSKKNTKLIIPIILYFFPDLPSGRSEKTMFSESLNLLTENLFIR